MDEKIMREIFSKQEAKEAVKRLVDFFQNYEGDFFGLDDLGIIDMYIEMSEFPPIG